MIEETLKEMIKEVKITYMTNSEIDARNKVKLEAGNPPNELYQTPEIKNCGLKEITERLLSW